jgi:hypothetical protein
MHSSFAEVTADKMINPTNVDKYVACGLGARPFGGPDLTRPFAGVSAVSSAKTPACRSHRPTDIVAAYLAGSAHCR